MHDLESGYRKIVDFHRSWMDKVVAVIVKKNTAVEQLQTTTEWEKEFLEQIFQITVDLQSSGVELESAHQNISSLESLIKSKKHSIHQLR